MTVLAAACRVETTVGIDVADDGSSVVEVVVDLDGDAAAQIGDPAAVRTQDLVDAGWAVSAPERRDDGGVTFRARRTAASPADLPGVLEEIGGVDGVFRDVALKVEDGFGTVAYDFAAKVELTGDLAQFSDAGVAEALDGLPLGRSVEELAAAGAADPDSVRLSISARLPGGEPTTNGDVSGDGPYAARWEFPMSGGVATSAALTSTSTASSGPTRLLVIGGAAMLVAGLAAGAVALVVRRRAL